MPDITASRDVCVVNKQGFHVRPAHLFMQMATGFQADVKIIKDNQAINGKSMMDLLTLGTQNGTKLTLQAIGNDAQAAVDALAQLVESGFGES
jgi:phosphotransferase system HPr (HPr) family protein